MLVSSCLIRYRALVATTDWVGTGHESPHRAPVATADWAGGGKSRAEVLEASCELRLWKPTRLAATFFGSAGCHWEIGNEMHVGN